MMRTHTTSVLGLILLASAPAQTLQLSTSSGGGDRHPVVSADGSVVAYAAIASGVRELFTVPIEGGTPKRHTTGADLRVGRGTFDRWPALSISDSGRRITYWSATGVHVVDTVSNTDTVVGSATVFPYPHVDEGADVVTWQEPVSGAFEVMTNTMSGVGTPTQLTTVSGPGNRFPHARGTLLIYQKPVSGIQELFLYDSASKTTKQVTTASGPGNRYGRLSLDGSQIVYEAVVAGTKEVWVVPVATLTPKRLTTLTKSGDRMATMTADEHIVFASPSTTLEHPPRRLGTAATRPCSSPTWAVVCAAQAPTATATSSPTKRPWGQAWRCFGCGCATKRRSRPTEFTANPRRARCRAFRTGSAASSPWVSRRASPRARRACSC